MLSRASYGVRRLDSGSTTVEYGGLRAMAAMEARHAVKKRMIPHQKRNSYVDSRQADQIDADARHQMMVLPPKRPQQCFGLLVSIGFNMLAGAFACRA